MLTTFAARAISLCFVAGLFLSQAGCRSSAAEASAADISGPPAANADYGARNPRMCAKVTGHPDVATAIALVQCSSEYYGAATLWLVTGLQVQMGSARAVNTVLDSDLNDVDVKEKIYPLKGTGTMWSCGLVSQWGAGTNCQKFLPTPTPDQTGRCWHTLFGEWKCTMAVGSPGNWVAKQPGPTTY